MKKLFYNRYTLSFILAFTFFNVVSANPVNTIVNGKVINKKTQSVALYKVNNGELIRLGFSWPDKDGIFNFNFPLDKESIFFIAKNSPHPDLLKYALYIKPGSRNELQLYSSPNSIDYDSCKIKTPNQETKLLQQWVDMLNPVYKAGQAQPRRDNFFSLYSKLQSSADGFKNSIGTSNKYFNNLLKQKIDVDMDFARTAAFFYFNERMNAVKDTSLAHRDFYEPVLQKGKYCNAQILDTDHGMSLLKYYTSLNRFFSTSNTEEFLKASIANDINLVCNDTLKGALVIDHMHRLVSYEEFNNQIVPLEKYFLQADMKEAYQKKKQELSPFAKGTDAYNFSLPDVNDKMVSLSDFKGKVVVVDIWAMWCAPCLMEKPFFQKVEEEFKHRDDIVFIGISHDGLSRKEVWKNFVAKKGWKNIELIANYDESVGKYYKIEGIPRFMIFDKEGKIVTVDAPRPSEAAFKKIIEQTLKANG